MKRAIPGLDALFVRLRAVGVPVGLLEIRRLGTVLASAPELDEDGLRQVVEAVVVKSQPHRSLVRRAYRQWLDDAREALADAVAEANERERARAKKAGDLSPGAVHAAAAAPQVQPHQWSGAVRSRRAEPGGDELDLGDQASGPVPVPSGPDYTGKVMALASPSMWDDAGAVVEEGAGAGDRHTAQTYDAMPAGPREDKSASGVAKLVTAVSLVAALVIGIAVFVAYRIAPLSGSDQADPDAVALTPPHRDAGPTAQSGSRAQAHVYVPQLRREAAGPQPAPDWVGILLPALALVFGAGLWSRFGQGRWVPSADPRPRPPRAAPPAPPRATARQTLILDHDDEENLVWGVGRFVSDEVGDQLDVTRTVHETAGAFGRPVLHYEAERYQREVWLCVDESMDSPAARHLADDLAVMLSQSGLPVIRARFWGVPVSLQTERDEQVSIDELEARRDQLAVAVLTDGRLLTRAAAARDRRDRTRSLLAGLGHWPRVTFIDFGRDDDRLAVLLERHGVRAIEPHDAAAAVSDLATGGDHAAPRRLLGDARVWAAACAMSPAPVDDRAALLLRWLLGLDVSPWAIEAVRASSVGDGAQMTWTAAAREQLTSWLIDAEQLPESGPLPESSLIARIGKAWDRIYDERERVRARDADDWEGSRDHQLLVMERALIHLWDHPAEATGALYALHRAGLGLTIRRHLQQMGPYEARGQDGVIALPWSLAAQDPDTQVMLYEMGFGARAQVELRDSLPRPGRLWLALGLCAGVGLGATGAIAHEYLTLERLPPEVDDSRKPESGKDRYSFTEKEEMSGGVRVWVRTPWGQEEAFVESGEKLVVGWGTKQDCEEPHGVYKIQRCSAESPRTYWSFAILDSRVPGFRADALSAILLGTGSVDGVFFVTDDGGYDAIMEGHALATSGKDQLLVVAREVPPELEGYRGQPVVLAPDQAEKLIVAWNFEGEQTLAERSPELTAIRGDPAQFRVFGFRACGEEDQPCCPEGLPGFEKLTDGCRESLRCDRTDDRDVCVSAPPRCTFTGRRCHPTRPNWYQECTPVGITSDSCGRDVCVDGECRPEICAPGARRCADREEQQCVDRGTRWQRIRRCGRDERCAGDRCVPVDRDPPPPRLPTVTVQALSVSVELRRGRAWRPHMLECQANGKEILDVRIQRPGTSPVRAGRRTVSDTPRLHITCSLAAPLGGKTSRSYGMSTISDREDTLRVETKQSRIVIRYEIKVVADRGGKASQ